MECDIGGLRKCPKFIGSGHTFWQWSGTVDYDDYECAGVRTRGGLNSSRFLQKSPYLLSLTLLGVWRRFIWKRAPSLTSLEIRDPQGCVSNFIKKTPIRKVLVSCFDNQWSHRSCVETPACSLLRKMETWFSLWTSKIWTVRQWRWSLKG